MKPEYGKRTDWTTGMNEDSFPDSCCGASINIDPARNCGLPVGHDGPHLAIVIHSGAPQEVSVGVPGDLMLLLRRVTDYRLATVMRLAWELSSQREESKLQEALWMLADYGNNPQEP